MSRKVHQWGPARSLSGLARADDSRVIPYLATAVAACAYSFLALRRVWELRANAFDAGFLDNVLYKVSTGLGDVTGLAGASHFADHVSVLLLAAVPLYWVDSGSAYQVLLVLQAVSVAMVGLAAWLIADTIGLSRWRRHAVLLYVLASPAAYWAIITELHLTGLAMGLVAMTIAGAYRRWRISVFWILPLLASFARIEIAATIVVTGLLLLVVSRIHALVTVAIGTGVAVLMALWMFAGPSQTATSSVYFDYLGVASVTELPLAMLRQPGLVVREVLSPVFLVSVLMWLVTVGVFLPMRAPRWFLVGVPMLSVAALSSPLFADVWYQHYWNLLLVGAAVAFVLSLAVWSYSDELIVGLVLAVLVIAWIIPGSLTIRPRIDVVYPAASAADQRAASIASSIPGSLSTVTNLVPPGAGREWVYLFPNPFVCRSNQFTDFVLAGPVPDVVITNLGWEKDVRPEDLPGLRETLATDYGIVERFGGYTVRTLLPGASPAHIDDCPVTTIG